MKSRLLNWLFRRTQLNISKKQSGEYILSAPDHQPLSQHNQTREFVFEAIEARTVWLIDRMDAAIDRSFHIFSELQEKRIQELNCITTSLLSEALCNSAETQELHRQDLVHQMNALVSETFGDVAQRWEALCNSAETQELHRQDLVHQMNALVSEAFGAVAQRWEARVQTATIEARAYSDDAAQILALGLRSQGRILAKHVASIAELNGIQQDLQLEVQGLHKGLGQSKAMLETFMPEAMQPLEQLNQFRHRLEQAAQKSESGLSALGEQLSVDYNRQLRNIEKRLEFVRREILYELQASMLRSKSAEKELNRLEPKIKSPEKVSGQLAQGLALNIGCGHIPIDGYVNVDRRDLPGVDIVAEATNIPIDLGSVTEIIASHLVEHFSLRTLEDVLLPYWLSLLAPDGRLVIVAPDGAAMLKAVAEGSMEFEAFREVLFGAQEYEGDFHLNLITTETITASLKHCGFGTVTVDYHSKPNGLCYEFRVTAGQAKN